MMTTKQIFAHLCLLIMNTQQFQTLVPYSNVPQELFSIEE
jgi:hypothetical protein